MPALERVFFCLIGDLSVDNSDEDLRPNLSIVIILLIIIVRDNQFPLGQVGALDKLFRTKICYH